MSFIGIIGARKYKDRQSVIELVETLPTDCVVVTSSCRGVCTWAGQAANAIGLEVRIFAPDLTDTSLSSGIRNLRLQARMACKRNY